MASRYPPTRVGAAHLPALSSPLPWRVLLISGWQAGSPLFHLELGVHQGYY